MTKKKEKTYYEMYQENKTLKKKNIQYMSFYTFSVLLFYLTFMINTATIGNYILSKLPYKNIQEPKITDFYFYSYNNIPSTNTVVNIPSQNTWTIYNCDLREVLAEGNCVDKAQAILSTLKRRYTNFDKIKLAISDTHVQVVRMNIDGSIDFLELIDLDVVTGKSEFLIDGFKKLIAPSDFLEAIDYYKPTINIVQLQKYLDKKYKINTSKKGG